MKAFTRPELDSLLQVAREASFEDYLMITMTFNHGLRVSEAVGPKGVTREHITEDGHIRIDSLKKSNDGIQPLLPNEREYLMQKGPGPLFPMSRITFWRRMQKYGRKAGVPCFLRHPHALRHTCGKLGFKGGMTIPEVQVYLRHKNGGNTLIYMQADEREASSAFAKAVGV